MKKPPKAGFEEAEEQRVKDESKRSLKTGLCFHHSIHTYSVFD
jgi:hypothetical protein